MPANMWWELTPLHLYHTAKLAPRHRLHCAKCWKCCFQHSPSDRFNHKFGQNRNPAICVRCQMTVTKALKIHYQRSSNNPDTPITVKRNHIQHKQLNYNQILNSKGTTRRNREVVTADQNKKKQSAIDFIGRISLPKSRELFLFQSNRLQSC